MVDPNTTQAHQTSSSCCANAAFSVGPQPQYPPDPSMISAFRIRDVMSQLKQATGDFEGVTRVSDAKGRYVGDLSFDVDKLLDRINALERNAVRFCKTLEYEDACVEAWKKATREASAGRGRQRERDADAREDTGAHVVWLGDDDATEPVEDTGGSLVDTKGKAGADEVDGGKGFGAHISWQEPTDHLGHTA